MGLESLDTKLAEMQLGITLGLALHGATLHLAVKNTLRGKATDPSRSYDDDEDGKSPRVQGWEQADPGASRPGSQTLTPQEPMVVLATAVTVVDLGAEGVQRHATLAVPTRRPISAPPRRPEHWIRMPLAPALRAY